MKMEDPAVTNFRDYLKIKSVQPNPDYAGCVEWLKKQAIQLGAKFSVEEMTKGIPMVILTIEGKDPSLSSIMLNSHTDVVPVFAEYWTYDPFSAHKDEKGDIYARGSQDMKCVGVQYLEAMRILRQEGIKLLRTVHITFSPDEEIGGKEGLEKFVNTPQFKALNVGVAFDEGYANPDEEMFLFYGERVRLIVKINIPGDPGHGSQFLPNNNGIKLMKIVNSFMEFRNSEEMRLKLDPKLSLGDVTTTNLTVIEGGVQDNVVPANISVTFDLRTSLSMDLNIFRGQVATWCEQAGSGIEAVCTTQHGTKVLTCVEDGKSKWWDAFSAAIKKENVKIKKEIFPAGTDGRFLRAVGLPVFGFSPMNYTKLLLHDHDECLNEKIFLRGIQIYKSILIHIGNVK